MHTPDAYRLCVVQQWQRRERLVATEQGVATRGERARLDDETLAWGLRGRGSRRRRTYAPGGACGCDKRGRGGLARAAGRDVECTRLRSCGDDGGGRLLGAVPGRRRRRREVVDNILIEGTGSAPRSNQRCICLYVRHTALALCSREVVRHNAKRCLPKVAQTRVRMIYITTMMRENSCARNVVLFADALAQ